MEWLQECASRMLSSGCTTAFAAQHHLEQLQRFYAMVRHASKLQQPCIVEAVFKHHTWLAACIARAYVRSRSRTSKPATGLGSGVGDVSLPGHTHCIFACLDVDTGATTGLSSDRFKHSSSGCLCTVCRESQSLLGHRMKQELLVDAEST